ncbi:peptidoglycan-associated lipoprotein [Desulfonema ishimotonii]|uniref:Peptidoglycan-associated lipoprotein n=1 Tax=Desulfonema ishimotonii TaxID=45657 RepID=A0A401FX67_9BACT|nr:peptidoglycan-associated lipoprotein Pal [Desulfonema ishimotonii]GBC61524.1 peptidoglycan-associated lipoprotein [Desulfonema ishimotonii]
MQKKLWMILAFFLIFPNLTLMTSCTKKVVKPEPVAHDTVEDLSLTRTSPPDSYQPVEQGYTAPSQGELSSEALAAKRRFENEDIYFGYDSSELSADAQRILKEKAVWLRRNRQASVIIEGHCDERGTGEYNLALGDRRGEGVKAYLVNLGIAPSRLTTVSYGEEKPLDPGHDDAAWARNRRAHFVIQ